MNTKCDSLFILTEMQNNNFGYDKLCFLLLLTYVRKSGLVGAEEKPERALLMRNRTSEKCRY